MNQKRAKQLKRECREIALNLVKEGAYSQERALAAKHANGVRYRFNLVNRLKRYHVRNSRLAIITGRVIKTQSGRLVERKVNVRKSSVHQMLRITTRQGFQGIIKLIELENAVYYPAVKTETAKTKDSSNG